MHISSTICHNFSTFKILIFITYKQIKAIENHSTYRNIAHVLFGHNSQNKIDEDKFIENWFDDTSDAVKHLFKGLNIKIMECIRRIHRVAEKKLYIEERKYFYVLIHDLLFSFRDLNNIISENVGKYFLNYITLINELVKIFDEKLNNLESMYELSNYIKTKDLDIILDKLVDDFFISIFKSSERHVLEKVENVDITIFKFVLSVNSTSAFRNFRLLIEFKSIMDCKDFYICLRNLKEILSLLKMSWDHKYTEFINYIN